MTHVALFLREILRSRKTGRLDFSLGKLRRTLLFQDGALVHTVSSVPGESLSDIFVRKGWIARESLPRVRRPEEELRAVQSHLVEKHILTPVQVRDAMGELIRRAALNMFHTFDAEAAFQDMPRLTRAKFMAKIGLAEVIAEGIRGMGDVSELESFLGDRLLRPSPSGKGTAALHGEEEKLLSRIDGRTSGRMLQALSREEGSLLWKRLFLLYALGLLEVGQELGLPEDVPEQGGYFGTEDDQLADVLVMKERAGVVDPYELFGLSPEASESDVKRAYFKLARRFHPDAFRGDLPADTKQTIYEVFDHLTQSYQILASCARKGVPLTPKGKEEETALREQGAALFEKATGLYNKASYEEAAGVLREAVRLVPEKGEYFLLLAKSESKVRHLGKKAEQDYLIAHELEPESPEPLVGLGLLYKSEKLVSRAAKHFRKALELDPNHPVARREFELLTKGRKAR